MYDSDVTNEEKWPQSIGLSNRLGPFLYGEDSIIHTNILINIIPVVISGMMYFNAVSKNFQLTWKKLSLSQ